MPPSRRSFLRTYGSAVGLSLALAGCLSSTGDERTGGTTDEPTRTTEAPIQTTVETSTATTDGGTEKTTTDTAPPGVRDVEPAEIDRGVPVAVDRRHDYAEPYRALAVGDREGVPNPDDNRPHHVWVWNDTEGALSVDLSLTTDGATGDVTVLHDAFEIPAGTPLALELREPRDYELTVRGDGREETVDVSRSQFDCNASATDVVVKPNGVESSTVTTDMACRTTSA